MTDSDERLMTLDEALAMVTRNGMNPERWLAGAQLVYLHGYARARESDVVAYIEAARGA
jgi:hypothetical protein